MNKRERIYKIIEPFEGNDLTSKLYDGFIVFMVVLSLIPLVFKNEPAVYAVLDPIIGGVFLVDYALRLVTADFKFGDPGNARCFVRYPFTFMAVIDLLSILPMLTYVNNSLRVLRMFRIARALRLFKVFRYSHTVDTLKYVLRRVRKPLLAVALIAMSYIFVCALIIFNVEPDVFNTFFDALYWSTVMLTTVGFGDIVPVTTIGRMIAMSSAVFGIAIVALPSGIVTAGLMQVLNKSGVDIENLKTWPRYMPLDDEEE